MLNPPPSIFYVRIAKKHDKQTGRSLSQTLFSDFLEKRPFYRYDWDLLIVKLSKLYDLVRTRGHPVEGDSSAGGTQSAFVRQTTKYWVRLRVRNRHVYADLVNVFQVHPDNLVALKLAILRHLPVLGNFI